MRQHVVERCLQVRARAGVERAELEVLQHRHERKQPPAFRHHGEAARHHVVRGQPVDLLAVEADRAGRAGRSPEIVLSSVVLPAPFAPTTDDDLAGADGEADVVQHRHVAVAGADALRLEQRGHACPACFLPR